MKPGMPPAATWNDWKRSAPYGHMVRVEISTTTPGWSLEQVELATAAWVRTFWTLPELARCDWFALFGVDHGMWA